MGTYNKAKTAVEAALERMSIGGKGSGLKWMDKWAALNGKFAKMPTQLAADSDGVVAIVGGYANTSHPRLLTKVEAINLAKKIDALAIGSDHLDVKSSAEWQRMYQKDVRGFPFMNTAGAVGTVNIDSIPCHNCGIVLPSSMVHVDHHMPQSVGSEDLYTLKIARALGLTNGGPSGGKGGAFVNATLGTLVLHPKGRDSSYNHLYTASAGAKWTTNSKGEAFFSLLANCPGALSAVQGRCKNNLLNLVPLCGKCNQTKSDYVRPIQ